MKKTYLFPVVKVKDLYYEENFLLSFGGTSGEDLGDSTDVDPWGND